MIDVSYFQTNNANTQIFQSGGTWQTWIKPRNAKTVNFFVVGAGAGGGGGFISGSGVVNGGGGGGSGGYTKLIVQASILPDILYILPGTGGTGGIGGVTGVATAGSSATRSFVCLTPDTSSVSNIVCTSGTTAATGGQPGSTAIGVQGAAETQALVTNMLFANLGNFLAVAGINGNSGAPASAGPISVTSFIVGAGGGGGTSAGSTLTAGGPFPALAGSVAGTNGKNGLIFYKPIFGVCGGTGGGSGGKGGNGAPGCGGGGGGAGTSTAGNGGNGGDGFVIITTNF